jgi:hypothetical protein
VAVVARVLLDHVHIDPADVAGALRVVAVAGHDIIKLPAGHGGACVLYFLLECLDVGVRVRVIKRLEVLADELGYQELSMTGLGFPILT